MHDIKHSWIYPWSVFGLGVFSWAVCLGGVRFWSGEGFAQEWFELLVE